MTTQILEKSKVKVRARICDGKATTTNVKFVFYKDGTKLEEKPAELPSTESLGDSGWVEAEIEAPEVDATKKNYELTYEVELADRKVSDLPPYTVWPSKGKLKVTPATNEHANMKGFRFRIKQNSQVQGEERKTVTNEDGTYEFELIAGHAFTLEALPPYEITEWVKNEGHEVECKATMKFEADFFSPQAGDRKQYVNIAPADASAADVGRDQKGPVVVVKLGVKGDPDRADEDKFGKEGMIVHFRGTFGPKVGNGGIEKSKRDDSSNKTEIKKELQVEEVAKDGDTVYKGKLKLKADGTAEIKVYLGLAGGDTLQLEIAGSDKFLDDSVPADAKLTFTNWRKSFYELLASDYYANRELEDVDVDGTTHKDYPSAGRTKFKSLGDSVFIEYVWVKTHTFAKDKAPKGTVLPLKFLELGASGDGYILTDWTMGKMPTGTSWDKTHANQSNYIKLCDANYYWEQDPGSFPHNRYRYRDKFETDKPSLDVFTKASGYFIPVSGNGSGTGKFTLYRPSGAEGVDWVADVRAADHKTVVDPVTEDRSASGQPDDKKTITITESNQTPAACVVEFTKQGEQVPTAVGGGDKSRIENWLTALFEKDKLKAKGNKISVTIKAEGGSGDPQTRYDAVKSIVETKLSSLKSSKSIAVHPGLDDSEQPRKGTLGSAQVDMATSTRKKCVLTLPKANPTDPGSFVGPASKTKCPIKIDTYIEAHDEGLGLCEGADVLSVFRKAAAAAGVCTTLHELGHSYNQTVYTAGDKPPKGMPRPKKVSQNESDNRYKHNGSKGHMYDEHDHSGSHCAYGLSDTEKARASYANPTLSTQACVMFGEGNDSFTPDFCPVCVDYIRGANLKTVPAVKE